MSSANPVRSDPLTDWLQPSNENLDRVARVEENEDMQDTEHGDVLRHRGQQP